MAELPAHHVLVKFGNDIPVELQGPALLQFERHLRQLSALANFPLRVEVFKESRGDDSKLRNAMTFEQRAKL